MKQPGRDHPSPDKDSSQPAPPGIQAPAIELPKGGGAIRGIGEKFAANPVTGTGSMSVPIATSPGRSGFGPQLSLSYDSGAGNGPYGFGWSLSLPSITRKTDKGLPQYFDAQDSDVFLLSGAEDLVPVLGANGQLAQSPAAAANPNYRIKLYRPRIEGLFARIERWTLIAKPHEVHWRSISKDNILTLYGNDTDSRIADPEDASRIFSWLICETRDDKGNGVLYRYKAEDGLGVVLSNANERNRGARDDARRSANRYLKHIYYGNRKSLLNLAGQRPPFLNNAQIASAGWMFEVVFDYGEHHATSPKPDDLGEWTYRKDPFSTYRAGFEVRTTRRCKRVLMFHHFAGEVDVGTDCLVRSTDFAFTDIQDPHDTDTQDPHDARNPIYTFLEAITQTGYVRNNSGYYKRSLPPVEFGYTQPIVQETVHDVDASSLENLPIGVDGNAYQWTDLHGEGIPGILTEQADAWFYKRNVSPISTRPVEFAALECVATKPNLSIIGGRAQFMDLAGDGQPDLVVLDGPIPGLYEHDEAESWQPFRPLTSRPNRDMRNANLKFVDLDGDGHADVLITEDDAFVWHASLAEAGFGPARRVARALDEEKGPRVVFADGTQSIYLADLSGDGLTDLVRIRNGDVCYWPNLGYARFGAKVTMDQAPYFDNPDQFDHKRIRLADIDGSGTTDLIYLHRDGVRLYFNQSGNGWSAPQTMNVFPRVDDIVSIVPTDLFGNGTACLVWSSLLPGDARRQMRYVDLMGGQKPHLLIRTSNNLGAETEVDYAPSTKFYLADKYAGKPWITKLPFPVHCVEKVTVTDQWRQTSFSTKYSYHHGYFDGIEREFRGFGRVEQVDTEGYGEFLQGNISSPFITDNKTLYQPPIKSVTWYHTGFASEHGRIPSAFEQEYFAVPGFAEHKLPQPTLTPSALIADEWREAARACKGMVLRQEVYELDVDALEQGKDLPVRLFTTAYHNSHIQRLQPQGQNRHAVFLVTESEAITYNYELDLKQGTPDPRIAHTLNLRFDNYGRALQTVAVAYPRQVAYTDPTNTLTTAQRVLIQNVQRERHLAYTETHYTAGLPDDPHQHRLPAPCETLTYELTGAHSSHGFTPSAGLYFSLDNLRAFSLSDTLLGQGPKPVTKRDYHQQALDDTAHKRIVEWVRMLYFKDDLSDASPFGQSSWLGLPYETYKLALTGDLLTRVFGTKLTNNLLLTVKDENIGGYSSGAKLAARLSRPITTEEFWIRSGTAGFESDAAQHFYLPERYTDPFNNTTTLKYDSRDLFIQSSSDARGNTTRVDRFDYRVLAPREMVDINDNHTEVYFDILGMVVAAAVKGKKINGQWEADNLDGFSDALANPPPAAVVSFCTSATLNNTQASTWLGNASARFVYHFGERIAAGKPVWHDRMAGACGIARERHARQVALDPLHKNPLQVALECSDGGGNVLMKKVQAEPDPVTNQTRWIVNGLTVLNNKGKPVKQYEPSFVSVFGCTLPTAEGVTTVIYYDSAGRVVRTKMPDGTLSRVQFSPWHVQSFDANDTVKESRWYRERLTALERGVPLHAPGASPEIIVETQAAETLAAIADAQSKRAARLAAQHAETPTLTILDSLGRDVISIAHNRITNTAGVVHNEKYLTYTKLDAEGKPLWIRDARSNLVMQYITPAKANDDPSDAVPVNAVPCYDIAGNLLFQQSMDAGDRWMIMDAAGKPMLAWDFNKWQDNNGVDQDVENRIYFTEYDALHRPTHQWLTINNQPRKLIDYTEYGETLANAKQRNLRGQVHRHYDPSGLNQVVRLDFKGKPLEVKRTLTHKYDAPVLSWNVTDRNSLLEKETYSQLFEYDALGRMTTFYNWHRGVGQRVAVYLPEYSERGALKSEKLIVRATKTAGDYDPAGAQESDAITGIRYNAKGQKEFLTLGNGTVTRYTYDPKTFRLINLHTRRGRVETCGAGTSSAFADGHVIQDLRYIYDPVGNITEIRDPAFKVVFFQNQRVEPINRYEYDALYRLVKASGRENGAASGAPTNIEPGPLANLFPCVAANAFRNYEQTFRYDRVGNIEQVAHQAGNGSWTRDYSYAFDDTAQPASNRLWQTWEGGHRAQAITYHHDTHGSTLNLANVAAGQYMRWDYRDMIRTLNLAGGGTAYYNYDASKQRSRKVIETQTGVKQWERIYLGGLEIYRRYSGSNVVEEIESLHLLEGEQRALLVEDVISTTNTRLPTGSLYRYQYSNHLGSTCLELDDWVEIISYEEYHPYGTSAYRAKNSGIEAPPKRYRYTGMERDEESGLSYHTARYYAAWLGRWASTDPRGISDGPNVYSNVRGQPVRMADPTGTQGVEHIEFEKGHTFVTPTVEFEEGHTFVTPTVEFEEEAPTVAEADIQKRSTMNLEESLRAASAIRQEDSDSVRRENAWQDTLTISRETVRRQNMFAWKVIGLEVGAIALGVGAVLAAPVVIGGLRVAGGVLATEGSYVSGAAWQFARHIAKDRYAANVVLSMGIASLAQLITHRENLERYRFGPIVLAGALAPPLQFMGNFVVTQLPVWSPGQAGVTRIYNLVLQQYAFFVSAYVLSHPLSALTGTSQAKNEQVNLVNFVSAFVRGNVIQILAARFGIPLDDPLMSNVSKLVGSAVDIAARIYFGAVPGAPQDEAMEALNK